MVEATEVKEGEQQPQPEEEEAQAPQAESAEKAQEQKPPTFTCGICGKSFEKPESLKSHRLRSHRISTHVEVGQEGVTSAEHAPPSTLQEAPPSTTYPTDRDHLHNLLTKLRFTRVDAAVEACDIRGYTVTAVYAVLKEMNASEAITRSAVSYWSRVKGEAIPYYIKARLGISDVVDDYQSRVSGYDGGYGYGGYGYGYPARQHEGDYQGLAALVRALKENGGLSQQGGDNEQVISLQNQLSSLQKELHELKEDQAKREVQTLRQEIGELKELVKKNSGDETLKFLGDQLGETRKTIREVGQPFMRQYGRRVYEGWSGEPMPESESPAREKPKSIMGMIQSEMIEEEAQKEEGEQQT